MDSKLILAKCITLAFCENIASNGKIKSTEVILGAVGKLKLPEQVSDVDAGRLTIIALRETLYNLINDESGDVIDVNVLLQRIRIDVGDDIGVYDAIEPISKYSELPKEDLLKICRKLRDELHKFLDQMSIKEIISKAHRDLFYSRKPLEWDKFINSVVSDLETHTKGMNKAQKSYMLNLASMSDPKSIAEILEKAKQDNEGVGGFKTGWQAVNRMLGDSENLRRGMFVLVGALTHCYKSGFTHDLFRHACIYNHPHVSEKTKKPAILYFSSENRAEEDLIRMYVALKENETGEAVNIRHIDPIEASEYISKRLMETGFHVEMMRIDGGNFSYMDLFNLVIEYESAGYEIQAIFFDYLSLIELKGIQNSMQGEGLRQLMQRVRTFMSARDILFVTPHQLSQEAMSLKRSGVNNFVSEIASKNYWDGSKRIANEADLEIFLDIVHRDNKAYLAVHRGKHRTVKATAMALRHFFLPFEDIGFVPDDINGEDRSIKDINSAGASAINWD